MQSMQLSDDTEYFALGVIHTKAGLRIIPAYYTGHSVKNMM